MARLKTDELPTNMSAATDNIFSYRQIDVFLDESSDSMNQIADQIVMTCGLGRTLDISSRENLLVAALLQKGVDAHGVNISEVVTARCNGRFPDRFTQASVLELPFEDESFDAVVSTDCMKHLAPDDVPVALKEIHRVTKRFVFLQIATTQDQSDHRHLTIENRSWWESRCFEAGFRKHPLYYRINPYESLDADSWQIYVLLEKVPETALESFALNKLAEERLLHCDMLRETGRRSDALCIRYYKAAAYIRPGDRILDVACGLGYGSHIIYSVSQAGSVLGIDASEFAIDYAKAHYQTSPSVEFALGDVQNLANVPDHSIDFITAFETIEHVEDPIAYLSELKRVLKPGGRVMICAPNAWVDETGKDPNSDHRHVYTWKRLVTEAGKFFLLEEGIFQVAGGTLKCPNGNRFWTEFPVDQPPAIEPEWVMLVAMADPMAGKHVPYSETTWSLPDTPNFHVTAFGRDYDNPWLVKSMVTRGMRMRSPDQLAALQAQVLSSAAPDSADYGAALCGHIYSEMGKGLVPTDTAKMLETAVWRYASIQEPSPHQRRWQISLLFAAGELARTQGRIDDAVKFFSECALRDAGPYSPLLGNKTLDALFWLAQISLARHDIDSARQYLRQSIEETHRLVSGSWTNIIGSFDSPLPFGLAEISQLFDKASRSAYMLSALQNYEERPFICAQESSGFFERHLNHYRDWGASLATQLRCRDQEIEDLKRLISDPGEQMSLINKLTAERDALSQMLEHARRHLSLLEQSRSWRVTRPLRWANRVSGRISWYWTRFESVRRNYGMGAAVRRALAFLQSRASTLGFRGSLTGTTPLGSPKKRISSINIFKTPEAKGFNPDLTPIFMLVDTFHDGGVERVVIDLCMQLRESGRLCCILVAKDGGRSAQEARSHGIDVIEFKQDHYSLSQFISTAGRGIVVTHHCYFALEQFHNAKMPIVELIHNAYHWQKGNPHIAESRDRFISKFVAVSQFVKSFSTNQLNIDPSKITLINNGLSNVDLIRPPLELLRKKRLQTRSAPILLHVANLHPQKNHRLIANAFANVKKRHPEARLIMAGAMDGYPELYKTLMADIDRLGLMKSIDLPGALSRRDLSRLMASAHVALLPSILEGFSIATLEFSFFGLPSVLSATGAAEELKAWYGHVEIAEDCALTPDQLSANAIESALKDVPGRAIASLSSAILKVLDNYPEYLEKGLSAGNGFSSYSVEHTATQFSKLLISVEETGELHDSAKQH